MVRRIRLMRTRSSRGAAPGCAREGVLLRDASALSAAGNPRHVEAVLLEQAPDRGAELLGRDPEAGLQVRQAQLTVRETGRIEHLGGRRRRRTPIGAGLGRRGGSERPGGCGGLGGRVPLLQAREQGSHLHVLALGNQDFGEHAGLGRGKLHRRLVGLELDERLVGSNGIAGRDEPRRHRRLAYGLPQVGHYDVDRHGGLRASVSASRARRRW
jgi:hypothetical protein